jgi:hypothetical protein
MTIFIDIAGSWIIRVSMISVMLGISVQMNDALYKTTNRANTRAYLGTVDTVMYCDLNSAGYNTVVGTKYWMVLNNVGQWVTPDAVFWTASPTDCEIFADINNDGTPEVVEYYAVKNATTGLYTMTRTVNDWKSGNYPVIGQNFTNVKFTYYDVTGVVTTTRSAIASVRIQLSVPIPGDSIKLKPTDTSYVSVKSSVDFRVFPANL